MMRVQCVTAIIALTCVVPAVSASAQSGLVGSGYSVMSDADCDCGGFDDVYDECGMCCPRILPAIWSGLRNALDCLVPCGSCCNACGAHHFPHFGRYSYISCRNCWDDYCVHDEYPSDGAIVVPAPDSVPQMDGPPVPPPDLQGRRTWTAPVRSSLYYGPRRPVSNVGRRSNITRSAQRASGKTVSLLKNNSRKRTEATAPRELSVTIAEALEEADAPVLNAAETSESSAEESTSGKHQTVRRTSAHARLQDRVPHNPLRD